MIQTSLGETHSSADLGKLAKNSAVILSLQAAGIGLTYLTQIILARWMGRTEYGVYEYAISWSLVLAIPVSLGLPRATLRFISEYRVQQSWGKLRGLLLSSWQLVFGVGLLLSLASIEIISLLDHYEHLVYAPVLIAGVWLIPLQALSLLHEDMARGADSIVLAYGPSKVLCPLLILIGGSVFLNYEHSLSSVPMVQIASIAFLAIVLFQFACLWLKFDKEIGEVQPAYMPRQWLLVSLPLLFDQAFDMLLQQIDILMLGLLVNAGAVGLYTAAAKTALWTSFMLYGLNLVASPAYAILYAQGDKEKLQKVVSEVILWICVPSIVIALLLAVFSQLALSSFGMDFLEASWALRILIVGQLIDALCGSVGNLMIMTGYQNKSLVVSASCAAINLILNAILIPRYGIVGAAIATSSTLAAWNIWLYFLVVQYVGVNPSIFYSLRNKMSVEKPD